MPRLDTSLESSGAEFLVLGHLLIEGIQAFKAYTNFPGYDLIATNANTNRACRVQVKSRWATDFDGGFPIKNFNCDFVSPASWQSCAPMFTICYYCGCRVSEARQLSANPCQIFPGD